MTAALSDCAANPVVDVVFIVDGSSSVMLQNFQLVQTFVREMIEGTFRVENDAARVKNLWC